MGRVSSVSSLDLNREEGITLAVDSRTKSVFRSSKTKNKSKSYQKIKEQALGSTAKAEDLEPILVDFESSQKLTMMYVSIVVQCSLVVR